MGSPCLRLTAYRFVCPVGEIPPGSAGIFLLAGVVTAVFHTSDGFFAHSGVCQHNAFRLELCEISSDIVRCPRHGWKYCISSGKGFQPARVRLANYPVEIRGRQIWVQPAAGADPSADYDTTSYHW